MRDLTNGRAFGPPRSLDSNHPALQAGLGKQPGRWPGQPESDLCKTTHSGDHPIITSGSAPFTGSYQPEQPLSVLDGLNAAGDWQLEVIDDAGIDTGTLESWDLILTYVSSDCSAVSEIFSDGFESGDTSAWSDILP